MQIKIRKKKEKLTKDRQENINNISGSGYKQFHVYKVDLSNFVIYDKKKSLLLKTAKSNKELVEKFHSKPQETQEFKINEQKESLSFDVLLQLEEKWMMGVTSLEVCNTVCNISTCNNKLEFVLTDQPLKELGIEIQLTMNFETL